MQKQIAAFGGLVGCLSLASAASAHNEDPCDFASSGASAFSYEQVMRCYRSVPFVRGDRDNIVQVIAQHRSFSDLSELYDSRIHWKQALAEVARSTYDSDLSLHEALNREHRRFANPHIVYIPPACYWAMLQAFVPLDFGAAVRRVRGELEQIVFIEGAPLLPELYQQATGVDANALVGLRVVSIDGVPVLDYFRHFAEEAGTHTDAGGGLNSILANFEYTGRLGPADLLPKSAADTYVLESADGKRQEVVLPWVFALLSALGSDAEGVLPPSTSRREFAALCQAPLELDTGAVGGALPGLEWGVHGREVDGRRHHMLRRTLKRQGRNSHAAYYEVPPERSFRDIEEITPVTSGARVQQYRSHVTALRLYDTGAWIDIAREGIEYACEHSDRLIIDLRSNGGGNDTTIRWLHHYLFPEQGALTEAGLLPLRMRNDRPALNEFLLNTARFERDYLGELGATPCDLFYGPGCLTNVSTGDPLGLGQLRWFESPRRVETRGGERVSLTREVGLGNFLGPDFDSASCAGRFAGDDLVLITNGSNASGGYFLPAAFKGDGVIVNTGGFLGESMAMGRCRGGATTPASVWAQLAEAYEELSGGEIQFQHRYAGFVRAVDSQMESMGAYLKDRRILHLDAPVEADLHADVWSDSPGSEGYVYEQVLRAVDGARLQAEAR
jgi:hypothetical protein